MLHLLMGDPSLYCWMQLRGRVYNLENICKIDRGSDRPSQITPKANPQKVIYLSGISVSTEKYGSPSISGQIKNLTSDRLVIRSLEFKIRERSYIAVVNQIVPADAVISFSGIVLTDETINARRSDVVITGYMDAKGFQTGFEQEQFF